MFWMIYGSDLFTIFRPRGWLNIFVAAICYGAWAYGCPIEWDFTEVVWWVRFSIAALSCCLYTKFFLWQYRTGRFDSQRSRWAQGGVNAMQNPYAFKTGN